MYDSKIGTIFHLQSHTYTHLYSQMNFEIFLSQLIMFDINVPLIIELRSDIHFFQKFLTKLNNKAIYIFEHLNSKNHSEIDRIYSINDDLVYFNFNHILEDVKRQNMKLFFFKNYLISFTNDRNNTFLSDILINKFQDIKFEYKTYDKFFKINRIKINRSPSVKYLDDNCVLDECVNSYFNFDYSLFYMFILNASFDSLSSRVESLIKEGDDLNDQYFRINIKDVRGFYQKILKYEENIFEVSEQLNIKRQFIKSIKNGGRNLFSVGGNSSYPNDYNDNNDHDNGASSYPPSSSYNFPQAINRIFSKISFCEFKNQERYNYFDIFKEKMYFFMESFICRIYEMELTLKRIGTICDIIKKAIRIRIDDNKIHSERSLNIFIVVLAIIQFLVYPVMILESLMSMNVLIPLKNYPDLTPFFFILLCLIIIPLGQTTIFIYLRNLIL